MVQPRDAFNSFRRGDKKTIRLPASVLPLLDGAVAQIVRTLEIRIFQGLTSSTPVDKGTARSGWTPSVGSQSTQKIDAPADDDRARQVAATRRADNNSKAKTIATSYLLRQGKVFITNPVPWIVPLDQGSSSQAPKNFVERTVRQAFRSIKSP